MPWSERGVSALGLDERHDDAVEHREVAPPDPDEPVSFEQHVRPLFRDIDRSSMRFAFDLWSHADVATHADVILARLEEGTMPCDAAWPAERVETFARWMEAGKAA